MNQRVNSFEHGELVKSGYAHVGGRLVNLWNTSKAIEANFSPKEMDEVLILTGVFAVLAAVSMVDLAETPADAEHVEKILEQVKAFNWEP